MRRSRRRGPTDATPVQAPQTSAVEAAVDAVASDRFMVQAWILKSGVTAQPDSVMRFPAFEHGHPHLLVYEPNLDAWRPVSLPPGGIWKLERMPDRQPALARLVGPDGRPLQ